MVIRQRIIAERLGLSIGTVSMALRNSPLVAEETRLQVSSLAEELGYQLRVRRSNRNPPETTVAQITFLGQYEPTGPFYSAVLGGAEDACRRLEVDLHYLRLEEMTPRLMKQCAESDGLLLVAHLAEEIIIQLQTLNRPIILVDNNLPHLGLDRVLTENIGSLYQMVMYLANLGHRRMAFMCGKPESPSAQDRRTGYRAAMSKLGLDAHELPYLGQEPEAIAQSIAGWYTPDGGPGSTALMVYDDGIAIQAMHLLQDRGIRVPEDVSITGFGDYDGANIVRPGITTRRVQREQLGVIAVRQLIERARNPAAIPQAIVLDTTLIERGSTGPSPEPV